MIDPACTAVPPKVFTPSRCAFESRPLRVEPPPLVLDMPKTPFCSALYWWGSVMVGLCTGGAAYWWGCALARCRNTCDLDRRVALTMAPTGALGRLVLVGEPPAFRPELFPDHPGGHRSAGQGGRRGQHGVTIHDQHRRECHL